jgi:hypothetical protein
MNKGVTPLFGPRGPRCYLYINNKIIKHMSKSKEMFMQVREEEMNSWDARDADYFHYQTGLFMLSIPNPKPNK